MTEVRLASGLPFRIPLTGDELDREELGAGRMITERSVLHALSLPRSGAIFDLDPGRFNGMPRDPRSPAFQLLTYRTPHGIRVDGDVDDLAPGSNPTQTAWIDELMIGTVHCGAHIDALSHVTRGEADEWHGGHTAERSLGDFGPHVGDAAQLPAIVSRGVLLDVAAAHDVPELPAGYEIGADDLQDAARREGVEISSGDTVLVRTGQMRRWPDQIDFARRAAGVVRDGAEFLAAASPLAVGSDTSGFETRAAQHGAPNDVHIYLLLERGVYIMEWLYLEELAAARMYEFLFIALPLKIQGATGSWLRPICIV